MRFWEDAKKETPFVSVAVPGGAYFQKNIFVEGAHESRAAEDTYIKAKFVLAGNPGVTARVQTWVTVTPVVNSIATAIPDPSVTFFSGAAVAMYTGTLGEAPGIRFTAGVTVSTEEMHYVQNVTTTGNGGHTGSGVGAIYDPASGIASKNFVEPGGNQLRPMLDVGETETDPKYTVPANPFTRNGSTATVVLEDSPTLNNPYGSAEAYKYMLHMDVGLRFSTHLTVRYSDVSLYTVAWAGWGVDFLAKRQNGVFGIVRPTSRVFLALPLPGHGPVLDGWMIENWEPSITVGPSAIELVQWR